MPVTAGFYGLGMKAIACGTVDLQGDTFGAMLTVGYTANTDTDRWRSDVTTETIGTSGYTVGGATLTGNTVTYDAASNETRWTFTNPSWTQASFSANQLVVYKRNGGTSSADELVMWVDFGGANTVTLGTFTYQVPATGAGAITV
jgi:hypothetical protein